MSQILWKVGWRPRLDTRLTGAGLIDKRPIPAVHDLERASFSAFAYNVPGAMYVTVIGLASALITG